jgi:cell division protease FtsH
LAEGLLEYETLTGEQIKRVMRGDDPEAEDGDDDSTDSGGTASLTAIPKTKGKVKPGPEPDLSPEPT